MKANRTLLRRIVVIAVVASVLLSVVGFLIAPPILKAQLVKRLTVELGRPVRIEKVRVNPWVLSVAIEGLAVADRDGGAFVGWDRIYVNFDSASFIMREWRFQEISAVAPSARVIVNKDGSLNFSDLLAKFAPTAPAAADSKPAWPLRVAKLVVSGAQLDFADHSRSREFATHLGPVDFTLLQFYTAPNRRAPYEFTAATESGEKLHWVGTVSVNPLASEGELQLAGIQLAKYAPYYRDLVRFDILSGNLDVGGRYKAAMGDAGPSAFLSEGRVHLTGLKIAPRDATASVLDVDDLAVTGLEADAAAMAVKISKIALTGGRASVHRAKDGTIDLLAMIEPATPPVPAPAAGVVPATVAPGQKDASAPKPRVEIAAFSVRQFSAAFEDQATPRQAVNTIENADIDLENITLADGAQIPLRVALTLPNRGAINVNGSVVLSPLEATVAVDLANVSLATISPYLEPMLNVHITQGAVLVKGKAHVALPAGQPPALAFTGDVAIDQFGLVDGIANEPLAGWGQLSVNGIEFKASPIEVSVESVTWTDPTAHVIVNRDQTINLAAILKPAAPASGASAATVPSPASATPALPKISIGKVTISNGAFSFVDHSVQPEVSTAVNQFSGTITGLSSENLARADVDLKATVDGSGPVAITGKLDPLGVKKSVDLKIDFKDVELTPYSPYSGKFAGYEIARGKLFVDVKARLDDRKVDMANLVTLTQFTFGSPTTSPDATKLPVRLAVALLKDTDGKIAIDLPVQGSLDDPEFKIGRVVGRVMVNLLTKVAVSPFSLLGAMFGGGGEELAYQDFAPGGDALMAEDMKKLETLTKALGARPGLNLEIAGSFDPGADAFALKQARVAQRVRSRLWDERRAVDATVPPPEQLVITPEQELATVQKMFAEAFPEGVAADAAGPATAPAPMAAPVSAPERKGFLKRTADLVTLKSWRERHAEKKQAAAAAAPAAGPAEVAAGPSLEEMKARLAEKQEVTNDDLRRLAARRAQQVRDYFVAQHIAGERLFLANVANDGKGPRVFLQLQ